MHAHPLTHVTGLFERDDRVTIPNPLLELLRLRHFYCPHSRAPIPKEWTGMRVGFTDSPPAHGDVQDAIHRPPPLAGWFRRRRLDKNHLMAATYVPLCGVLWVLQLTILRPGGVFYWKALFRAESE